MTPQPSTEPVFGILMSELSEWEKENLCWSEVQDLQQRIRARGPVHSGAQQQAPAPRTYETCHKHFSCPDGEECWYLSEDYYWDCGKGAARVSKAVAQAAAAERERVLPLLERLATAFHDYEMDVADYDFPAPPAHRRLMDDLQEMIDSLRSQPDHMSNESTHLESVSKKSAKIDRLQPEKHPEYCKHLKWLNQVEGGGEYRCELGNETSDEWCYKKERCRDYELVPECGACTGPDPLDVLESGCDANIKSCEEALERKSDLSTLKVEGNLAAYRVMKTWIAELRRQVKG